MNILIFNKINISLRDKNIQVVYFFINFLNIKVVYFFINFLNIKVVYFFINFLNIKVVYFFINFLFKIQEFYNFKTYLRNTIFKTLLLK